MTYCCPRGFTTPIDLEIKVVMVMGSEKEVPNRERKKDLCPYRVDTHGARNTVAHRA